MSKSHLLFHFLLAACVFLQKFCLANLPGEVEEVARPWLPHYDKDNLQCPFLLDPRADKFPKGIVPKVVKKNLDKVIKKGKQLGGSSRRPLLDPDTGPFGGQPASDYFKKPEVLKGIPKTEAMKNFLKGYPEDESELVKKQWVSEAFHHLLTKLVDTNENLHANEDQLNSWLHVFGYVTYSSTKTRQVEPRITMIYGLYTVGIYSRAAEHEKAAQFAEGLAESIMGDVKPIFTNRYQHNKPQDVWETALFLYSANIRYFMRLEESLLQESRKFLPQEITEKLQELTEKLQDAPKKVDFTEVQKIFAPVFDPKTKASAYSRVAEAIQYNVWCVASTKEGPDFEDGHLFEHEKAIIYYTRGQDRKTSKPIGSSSTSG